ncbi:MAG: hypothetical protein RSE41_07385 [Clostridia bacterium]
MLVDYLTKLKCDRVSLDFENKLLAYLDNYYIVGGMPEVVNEWITNKNIEKVELIQERIINSYELDFSKHTPLYEIPKLNYVWKYIPRCLSKENSKFIYGNAKPGARAKDLEDALG